VGDGNCVVEATKSRALSNSVSDSLMASPSHGLLPLLYLSYLYISALQNSYRLCLTESESPIVSVDLYLLFVVVYQLQCYFFQRPEPRSKPANGIWLHDRAPTAPRANLQAATSNTKIVVSNLHYDITPKDLVVSPTNILAATLPCPDSLSHVLRPYLDRLARSFESQLSGYEPPHAPSSPEKKHIPTPKSRFDFRNLKYDRSGRSSGVAIISYETASEAASAKKQFDGILAKGNTTYFLSLSICPF
jgi:hypothetical protein